MWSTADESYLKTLSKQNKVIVGVNKVCDCIVSPKSCSLGLHGDILSENKAKGVDFLHEFSLGIPAFFHSLEICMLG